MAKLNLRKSLAGILCGVMVLGCLVGCSEKKGDDTTVVGRISSISDSEIQIGVLNGDAKNMNPPQGDKGPKGDNGRQKPPVSGDSIQGEPKSVDHGKDISGKPMDSGETKTIKINGSTKFYKESSGEKQEISSADLELGEFVEVTLDGDEASMIVVKNMDRKDGNRKSKNTK
ncbi:hypothetical protein [Eubacterium xylanophilum]|uniref:hypothetical protein n=1 Tax=Eubacterium xylanophilum TaxID=39497 RepID=UPI00047CC1AA|nr:hypothetical protein [Eubacterium xylanophilum]